MQIKEQVQRIKEFESKMGSPEGPYCYGMGHWLKKSLKIPSFYPMLFAMDHGAPVTSKLPDTYLTCDLPLLLTNHEQVEEYKRCTGKKAWFMGSPFVYCRRTNNFNRNIHAKATIAFPSHSTHSIKCMLDWDTYAADLLALPGEFHPIYVCLYWKDLLQGVDEVFLKKGFKICTAGHIADPDFTVNFYKILTDAKYVTSNHINSSVLYSIEMGIPAFLYGMSPDFNNVGGDKNFPQGLINNIAMTRCSVEQIALWESLRFDNLKQPVVIKQEVYDYCIRMLGLKDEIDKSSVRKMIYMAPFYYFGKKIARKIKIAIGSTPI